MVNFKYKGRKKRSHFHQFFRDTARKKNLTNLAETFQVKILFHFSHSLLKSNLYCRDLKYLI